MHQRDVGNDDELQLSLEQVGIHQIGNAPPQFEPPMLTRIDKLPSTHDSCPNNTIQAFYLVEECKRLEITLPEQQERPLGLLECWRAYVPPFCVVYIHPLTNFT